MPDKASKATFDLTEDMLIDYAGEVYFSRGMDYFKRGKVSNFVFEDGAIYGTVSGTYEYRVMLKPESDYNIRWSCSCPLGEQGDFCKHAVACGLAWIKREKSDSSDYCWISDEEQIEKYLTKQSKETLVKFLLGAASDNDALYRRLLMKADRSLSEKIDLKLFKKRLRSAIAVRRFIDYYHMTTYMRKVQDVVAEIGEILEEGNQEEALELCEYAIKQVETALLNVDDSDGMLGDELRDLEKTHLKACRILKPDPVKLAEKLFKWEMKSDWDVFSGALEKYGDLLNDTGRAKYHTLAEREWKKLPRLGPGDGDKAYKAKRFRLTSIMESLAKASNDISALIEIKKKNLSSPRNYLHISNIYIDQGLDGVALHWAEIGYEIFKQEYQVGTLVEFLIQQYLKNNRFNDAVLLAWEQYQNFPELRWYQKLCESALKANLWDEWRDKAVKVAIEDKGREKYFWSKNNSLLVEIFIWEEDLESAYEQAKKGGCSNKLWITLAEKFRESKPIRTAQMYESIIPEIIERGNNHAYEEALEYMVKIESILKENNKLVLFAEFVHEIKKQYKRKINMMKLIKNKGW